MLLLIDNYDSFTYNLKDYFEQLGEECLVIRNNEFTIEEIKKLDFDKVVLSPGPERPANAGILNEVISEFHKVYPILGICLGHQAIGEFFGAELVKANKPMHGKISAIKHSGTGIFKDFPQPFNVCRYHSLILEQLESTPLRTTASTNTNEIMAFEHTKLPIWGTQFHPESILTQNGIGLLSNWLTMVEGKTVGF